MSRIGIKIDIGEGKIGVVYAAPHEALKALEEQAPEVLSEWLDVHDPVSIEFTINNNHVRTARATRFYQPIQEGDKNYRIIEEALTCLLRVETDYDRRYAEFIEEVERLERALREWRITPGPPKSPWIKISDQEPPKDGKWFVTRDIFNQPDICDYLVEQHEWRDMAGNQYPEDSPPFILWVYLPKTESLPE